MPENLTLDTKDGHISKGSPPFLVGGFNPFEKYDRQNGFIFPKYG